VKDPKKNSYSRRPQDRRSQKWLLNCISEKARAKTPIGHPLDALDQLPGPDHYDMERTPDLLG
jgi:hypothetical protein